MLREVERPSWRCGPDGLTDWRWHRAALEGTTPRTFSPDEDRQFPTVANTPRGWGKGGRRGGRRRVRGIIPTRVGKGPSPAPLPPRATDHPHAGGERSASAASARAVAGSSPRGWGKDVAVGAGVEVAGIIPTRVGKGSPRPCPRPPIRDHPHAGGERGDRLSRSPAQPGSSPRGWGKGHTRPHRPDGPRIIPTRVGKGSSRRRRRRRTRDHPHAGGERVLAGIEIDEGLGSSPRGWGKGQGRRHARLPPRIIPTRVGKGPMWRRARPSSWDHPHAGGERRAVVATPAAVAGSSPRGWGKAYEIGSQCRFSTDTPPEGYDRIRERWTLPVPHFRASQLPVIPI